MSTGNDPSLIDKVRQLNSKGLEFFEKGKGGKGFSFIEEGLSELAKSPTSVNIELTAQYCFLASLHLRVVTENRPSQGFVLFVDVDTSGITAGSFMGLAIDNMDKGKRIKRNSRNTIQMSFQDWTQLYSYSKAVDLYIHAASILERSGEVSERSLVDILLCLKDLYAVFGLDKEAHSIDINVSMIVEAAQNRREKHLSQKPDQPGQHQPSGRDVIKTYVYPSGEIYTGDLRNGVPEGTGEICYPDGARYAGEIRDICPNGIGTYIFSDGRKYIGQFKDSTFHGEGTLTLRDGSAHFGDWNEGLLYLWIPRNEDFVHSQTGMCFPGRLSGMQRDRIIHYEVTQPGRGVSIGYTASKAWATVYIYTNNRPSIPSGSDSQIVNRELRRAEEELLRAKEMGQYDSVFKNSESKVGLNLGASKIDFIVSEFQATGKEIENRSFICLTGVSNHLLKIRFTYDVEAGKAGEQTRKRFMVDLGQIMISALK